MNGSIRRLVRERGFGFIVDEDGKEYFFHSSALISARYDDLQEGQRVTFNDAQTNKGPRAENVRLL